MRIKKSTPEESEPQVVPMPNAYLEVNVAVESPGHSHEHAENASVVIEKKKRGRKKLIKPDTDTDTNIHGVPFATTNVILDVITNADGLNDSNNEMISKEKKQRKPRSLNKKMQDKKQDALNVGENNGLAHIQTQEENEEQTQPTSNIPHKKRGRKPRGGKIIHENQIQKNNSPEVPNIILHLKCVLSDLKKSNDLNSNKVETYFGENKMEILCYNDSDQNVAFSNASNYETKCKNDNKTKLQYNKNIIENCEELTMATSQQTTYDPSTFLKNLHNTSTDLAMDSNVAASQLSGNNDSDKNTTNKEIWKKISQLKLNFHKNDAFNAINIGVQRSACFWDTCEFDTPPIYIPMSSTKGYGCFCHPECAVAYLMNENIDTSIKFERYYLLNSIYGPIYNYNKNIKPAANPHYLLNKFYGTLTINEYRKLFQCEQVVYMVNKPLTNVLPELYEDNNDLFIGNKIIQNGTMEIKTKVIKNAKSSIINEAFGIK